MHQQVKRIKTAASPEIITREEAERIVGEITLLTTARNRLAAEMDTGIAELRSRYETSLADLQVKIENRTGLVRNWALANPEEFGKRKSLSFLHGVIGFRTGTPKLKTLSGFTFAKVLEKLKSVPWGKTFIRIKEEIDKEALIAAHAEEALSFLNKREIGIRVDQEESFYIDPAVTGQENRQTTSGKEGK